MRGGTTRTVPMLEYSIEEPPAVFAVPAVTLMMGKARVTEMVAASLSSVTTRGVETTCASEDEFRKDSTALTPSALRKAKEPNPLAVLATTCGFACCCALNNKLEPPGIS